MADNQILISVGFKPEDLDKEIKNFVTKFRSAFTESLKNIRKDLAAVNFDKLTIKVSLDLSHAKKQVEDFQKTLKNLGVELADATDPSKLQKKASTTASQKQFSSGPVFADPGMFINQQKVDTLTAALDRYQQELRETGATEQEITKYTREYATQIKQLQSVLSKMLLEQERFERKRGGLQGPTLAGQSLAQTAWTPTSGQVKALELAGLKAEQLDQVLKTLTTTEAKLGIETDRVNSFMDSFGFKIGILGFGTGIFGAHLNRLSQAMFQFIDASAKATEPLERLQNLLIQDSQISTGERSFILAELNRLSDFPGSNLEQTAKTFRSLQTLGLATADSLKLLEGLTKATARSGIGAEGLDRIAAQLRDFVGTGQLRQQEIRSIISAGGKDISSIIQQQFGGSTERINDAGPQVFIQTLIENLGKLATPLETATDKINKLRNSFTRMRLEIQQLITPGLDTILGYLLRIEAVIAQLGQKFRELPNDQKKWISNALVSIPILGTALAGVLTTLSAIAIGIATAKQYVDVFRVSITALDKATGPLATTLKSILGVGSGAGIIGTASKLVSLTNPIGIAIQLLIAYATNFGKVRDSINRSVTDLVKSFTELGKALSAFASTKIGQAVITVLQAIYDLLEGIVGLLGEALSGVITLLAALVTSVADMLNAFSADTFSEFFLKLASSLSTFGLRAAQVVARLIMSVVRGLVSTVGNIMEKMGLLNEGFTKDSLKAIDDFTNKISDRNLVVENGAIVNKSFSETQKTVTEATNRSTEAIELQRVAFQKLADAAENARQKIREGAIQASISTTSTEVEAVRQAMQTAVSDFRASMDNIFDPTTVEMGLNNLKATLQEKATELATLNRKIADDNAKLLASSIEFDEFTKAAKDVVGGIKVPDVAVLLSQGITSMGDAKTIEKFEAGLALFKRGIAEAGKYGAVSREAMAQLRLLETQFINNFTKVAEEAKRDQQNVQKLLSDMTRNVSEAAESRRKQLNDARADLQARQELSKFDLEIEERQVQISKLRERVENFELTATAARKARIELEAEIATIQSRKDVAQLTKGLEKADPSDLTTRDSINAQIADREREAQNTIKKIRQDGATEQADVDAKALDVRNKRYEDAAKDLVKTLAPFEKQIVRALAMESLGGDPITRKSVFNNLADDLALVGENIEAISNLIAGLRTGAPLPELLKQFLGFQKRPLEIELGTTRRDLQNRLKALMVQTGAGGVPGGALSELGLTSESTDSDIKEAVNRLTDLTKIQRVLATFESGPYIAEVEEALGLLSKAKAIESEINNINLTGQSELIKKITEAAKTEQLSILDSQIKEIEAKLEESRVRDSARAIAIEKDAQDKLLRQIIVYNTRKELLEAQYRALALAADTKDAESKKRIFQDLQNELIAIRKRAIQQMLDETGAADEITTDRPISPTGDQANIPTQAPTQGAEAPIYKISTALHAVYESARKARGELMSFFEQISTGQFVLDSFANMMKGTGKAMDTFAEIGKFAIGAFAQAFSSALIDTLVNGGDFIKGFGKFLGQLLIMLGQALVQMGIAALAVSLIRFLFGDVTAPAMGAKAAAFATATGVGLMALGAAMGGGSKAASSSQSNTSNVTNTQTGAVGEQFDPNRDPRTVFQKALMAQIQIDIRTDDTQIVKTMIKHVNQNGRLTRLIGNRKLQFGY